jgi:hypothetical protein
MKKTNILKKAVLVALASTVLAVTPASAQNTTYAPGDLLLFFQQLGGTQTVMVNLGRAWTYRDATANMMNIVNIGGTLTGSTGSGGAGYSATWYNDMTASTINGNPDVPLTYWGLAAVRSTSDSNAAAIDGDGARTVYTSRSHTLSVPDGMAGSSPMTIASNTAMTTTSTGVNGMTIRMGTIGTTTILVESNGLSAVDNQNPFLGDNPGAAFNGNIPGGVMGAFGNTSYGTFNGVAAEGALDLYRILGSTTAAGTVDVGTLRTGQYQGTFIIDQAGSVSYITPVPEPSTFALLAGSAVFGLIRRRRSHRD